MSEESRTNLLVGAIDCHVHSAPDVIPRKHDDIELVEHARRAGMRAVMLKCHHGCTCGRAYLLNRFFPDFRVFGGIVLNDAAGGVNPRAVEAALRMGAVQVWMPTKSAANHLSAFGERGGLSVLNGANGTKLRREIIDILRQIADADANLATGHLSPEESRILVEEARAIGVRRVSVTHPEWGVTAVPIDVQRKLAGLGGVFFERCLVSSIPNLKFTVPFDTIVAQIRAVGPATTIAATDFGLQQLSSPPDGMATMIQKLLDAGFSDSEVSLMVRRNPARFLKLE